MSPVGWGRHEVRAGAFMKWAGLKNGKLFRAAEPSREVDPVRPMAPKVRGWGP